MSELHIRPYAAGDAATMHAAAVESLPELQPWMPWVHPEYSLAEAEAWVTMQTTAFEARTQFEFLLFDGDRFVGACGLNQLDPMNRRANLGYWIRSSAARKNYATSAVRMLVAWAHQHTDLIRLEVVIAVGNRASVRVAEKSGALHEATLRSRLFLYGQAHDAEMFAFIRGVNMEP